MTQEWLVMKIVALQHAKKVVSDNLGLVDFAIGVVIFVLNLPDRQVPFFGEIQMAGFKTDFLCTMTLANHNR